MAFTKRLRKGELMHKEHTGNEIKAPCFYAVSGGNGCGHPDACYGGGDCTCCSSYVPDEQMKEIRMWEQYRRWR